MRFYDFLLFSRSNKLRVFSVWIKRATREKVLKKKKSELILLSINIADKRTKNYYLFALFHFLLGIFGDGQKLPEKIIDLHERLFLSTKLSLLIVG